MDSREKAERLFQAGDELARQLLNKVQGRTVGRTYPDIYHRELLFMFAKAYKSYQAIRLLWNEGFWQDALIIIRTLFELDAQATYLAREPEKRADLFADYEIVAKYRMLREQKDLNPGMWSKEADATFRELEKHAAALKARHPEFKKERYGWYGMSVFELAKTLGEPIKQHYCTAYAYMSTLVHSDNFASPDYLDQNGGRFTLKCGPEFAECMEGPLDATFHLMDIVNLCNDAMGLGLGGALERVCDKWEAASDDLLREQPP